MYRRIAVVASLAVVAAMFVGSSTASAQSAGGCVFTGLAGNLVDDQNGSAGLPSIQKDLTDPAYASPEDPQDYEHGTYSYAGPATCAGVFNGQTVAPGANNATISSEGFYDNALCGTGYALDPAGTGTTIASTDSSGNPISVTGVGYEIQFAGGHGPLFIGTNAESRDPEHDGLITGDYSGNGVVQIRPKGGNCGTTDVNAFDVAGSFTASG
jgi:hypothetical protein